MHLRRKFFMAHPSPRLDPQSKTKRTSQTSHALEADSTGNPCSWIKALRQHQEAGQWGTDINSRSRERTNEIWQTAKIKYKMRVCLCVCSVAQSCLTLCDPMDSSPPGSSVRSPGACSNSYPLSQWCHPTISSSVAHFSFYLQSFSASRYFSISWLFLFCYLDPNSCHHGILDTHGRFSSTDCWLGLPPSCTD